MNFSVSTIILTSIVACAVLIYFPYLFVAYARFQVGMDMSAPRALFDKLPDYGRRATWAHQNAFESFMIFTAAAFMAYITGVNSPLASQAAIAHVMARFFYSLCYIFNIPIGRSLMFGVGSFSSGILFYLSIIQANSHILNP
ncbi:MAG TPA: MAPEG family protein [Allocoleopsis sp.]